MSDAPRPQGCPSIDDLSAAADGFLPEEISLHLDVCPVCQQSLQHLRRFDRAVQQRLTPPPGLAERVRQHVHAHAAERLVLVPRWSISPVLRLAAALAASAAAIAILVHVLGDGPAAAPTMAGIPVGAGAALVPTQDPALAPRPITDGNVELAGVQSKGSSLAHSAPDLRLSIPSQVRHVWTVPASAEEATHLRGFLPKGSYHVDVQDGNTVFAVRLPDRDLQKLVDHLYERKWQLVSAGVPQPQNGANLVLTGQTVRYDLVMVPR